MRLTNSSKTDLVNQKLGSLAAKLANPDLKKNLNEKQIALISDAQAIKATLDSAKLSDEDYNKSVLRIASLVKQALNEDVCPEDMRILPKEQLTKWSEEITPRGQGEGRQYKTPYPEDFSGKAPTRSMYDPARIADMIMRDLNQSFFISAQDAYDGYVQEKGPYGNASPRQKASLGKLLTCAGFVVDFNKFEKEAEKEKSEYIKEHTKQDTSKKDAVLVVQAEGTTNCYCNDCKSTTQHTIKENGDQVCKRCGTAKTVHKKSALALFRKAQMEQARPNILELAVQKLKTMFSTFQGQQPTTQDIVNVLGKTIDENYPNPTEAQEEKEYMLDNPAVLNQIQQVLNTNSGTPNPIQSSKTLREALSKEAQMSGDVTGQPGYSNPSDNANPANQPNQSTAPQGNMEKSAEMSCQGCGFKTNDAMTYGMNPNQKKNCPTCNGQLVPSSGNSVQDMNNPNNKQMGGPGATSPDDGTQINKQMSNGGVYQAKKLKLSN